MIDIKAIRATAAWDCAQNVHPSTIVEMCDEIERLRKDAAAYHAIMAELDMQMKAIK